MAKEDKKESKKQLFISLLIGLAAGAFIVYLKRRGPGDKFRNVAFEAVKYWGPDSSELPHPDLESIIAHEDDIREALKNGLKEVFPQKLAAHEETVLLDEVHQVKTVPELSEAPEAKGHYETSFEDHPAVKQAAKKVQCRHRWTKYLQQQEPRPTLILRDLLKRYERLHDKHLRDMALDEALSISLHSRSNKVRYLVWVPAETGGLHGQLLSLVSAFLFALLTDRVLLVDLSTEIEHVMCEPFSRSSWLLPETIKSRLLKSVPKALHAVRQRQPVRSALVRLERGNIQDDKHLLSCHGTLKAVFGHIQWLVVQADYTFIETIQSNRQHQHQLSELFKYYGNDNENTPFSMLNRYLIHPSNFLWEKITSQYHIHFSDIEPRPLRIVIHPGSLNEPTKHVGALRRIIAKSFEMTENHQVSVYLVPAEFGSDWLNSDSHWKGKGPMQETISVGTSCAIGPGISPFVGQWRKFLTDMWMIGLAHHYLIPEHLPISAVPGLLYRSKLAGVWLLSDQLDSRLFREPEPLPDWEILADRVDCSLIKRK